MGQWNVMRTERSCGQVVQSLVGPYENSDFGSKERQGVAKHLDVGAIQ